jgi:HxlR-like helix-turn-helix
VSRGLTMDYGQFCPIAKAAEVVAERWTPLVPHELLAGSVRFGDIRRDVPLMSQTLLSTRLKELERRHRRAAEQCRTHARMASDIGGQGAWPCNPTAGRVGAALCSDPTTGNGPRRNGDDVEYETQSGSERSSLFPERPSPSILPICVKAIAIGGW